MEAKSASSAEAEEDGMSPGSPAPGRDLDGRRAAAEFLHEPRDEQVGQRVVDCPGADPIAAAECRLQSAGLPVASSANAGSGATAGAGFQREQAGRGLQPPGARRRRGRRRGRGRRRRRGRERRRGARTAGAGRRRRRRRGGCQGEQQPRRCAAGRRRGRGGREEREPRLNAAFAHHRLDGDVADAFPLRQSPGRPGC